MHCAQKIRFTALASMLPQVLLLAVSASAEERVVEERVIEEIIVTAQKRSESAQEVPIALTAVTDNAIRQRGIVDAQDLQFLAPSLTIGRTNALQTRVTLRGVGSENIGVGGDPGVGLYVDGYYLQSSNFVMHDLFDIERIEVLRGPQGTLYGRNTVGGAINIVTRKPTDEFGAEAEAQLTHYSGRQAKVAINAPISESVRSRLIAVRSTRDGYIENVFNGKDTDATDLTSIRLHVEADVSDRLTALVSAYDYRNENDVPAVIISDYPTTPVIGGFVPNPFLGSGVGTNPNVSDRYKIETDVQPDSKEDARGASLKLTYDLGGVQIVSLTGVNENSNETRRDEDGDGVVYSDNFIRFETDTFSQELQFNYIGDRASFVGGVYYFREESDLLFDLEFFNLFGIPGALSTFDIATEVETDSLGVYGQWDQDLTERLSYTVGLRYSTDEKEFLESVVVPDFGLNVVAASQKDDWDDVSGKAGIQYRLNPETMIYGSYSTGYKSGGFNSGGLQPPYDPETVETFELGLKSTLADGRATVNVAVFHSDYADKQEFQIALGGIGTLTNAGAATIVGAELEWAAYLTDRLSIDGSVAYLDSEYDEFRTLDDLNPGLGVQDLEGNRLTRTPEWKVNVGVQYSLPVGMSGELTARADYAWVDEQYYRPINLPSDAEPSYHRTNLRLIWSSFDERYSIEAFVRNLEDDEIVENKLLIAGILGSNYSGELLPPRTYGVKLAFRFGD